MNFLAYSIAFRMLVLALESVENDVAVFLDETGYCIDELEPRSLIELETLVFGLAM